MTIDRQRMIDTAVAYFLAGERCRLNLQFGSYPEHCLGAPIIANYALAVEIGLKLLAHEVGSKGWGHNLEELYSKLPTENKAQLLVFEDLFEKKSMYEYVKNSKKYYFSEENERISQDSETSIPFIDWRYPFEKSLVSGSPDNLRRAFIACHREVRRVSPNLMSSYERNWGSFEPHWVWDEPEVESKQTESPP